MAEILRYVDPNAAAGGDGTTNGLSGGTCAYVSLNAWEAATQQDLTDGGGDTARVVCSSDDAGSTHLADTTAVTIDGWTTSATCYITIEAASSHGGKWNANIYRMEVAINGGVIDNFENYVKLIGLQIKETTASPGNNECTLRFRSGGGASSLQTFNRCILRGGRRCVRVDQDGTVKGWNSVAYGWTDGGFNAGSVLTVAACCYSCTSVGTTNAFFSLGATSPITAKNCYGKGTTAYTAYVTMTTCASSDATGSAGLQNIAANTTNFTNVTAGSEDFHLPAGSALIDVGTDTSGDAAPLNFTDDIDGVTRTGTWDIGADEYVVGRVVLTSPVDNSTGLGYPVVFSWQAYARAVQYELQVSPNADFSSPVMDVFTTGTTYSATPADGVALGTHYYWRVRASR